MTSKPKKKKASNKKNTWANRISDEQGTQMFNDWCEEFRGGEGFAGLGRKYKRQRPSVSAYAKRHGWEKRYQAYAKQSRKKNDLVLVDRHAEKTRLVGRMVGSAIHKLYEEQWVDDPDAPGGRRMALVLMAGVSLSDVVNLMKYEDSLMEKFPEQSNETASTMTEEQVADSLGILTRLGAAALEALGKFIVEKGHRLDKERQPQEEADSPGTH